MKAFARRLAFALAFVPVILGAGLWWIFTGDPRDDTIDAFIKWGTDT